MLSVVIPSRNEKYLNKTIHDLLAKAKGEIELIPVLDGTWPLRIVEDSRVHYIHFSESRGMRNAINMGVAIAKGEFILKTDAHCMFGEGFDEILKSDCEDNWVVIPRRFALDPEKWELIENPKYPVDYMYLSKDLHGEIWTEKNKDSSLADKFIDDLMSFQGSAWFMKRKYFDFLELMDEESYGKFFNEAQEIGFKTWLSGGRVVVNKKTWYAHWHKTESRGYTLAKGEQEQANKFVNKWLDGRVWHKQKYFLDWLIEKFKPVPTW